MKKVNVIIASLILLGLIVGCSGSASKITMTFKPKGEIGVALGGNGTATIDWGDGSPVETVTLDPDFMRYRHSYAQSAEYTIKITGENITLFRSKNENLEATKLILNVPTLIDLDCSNTQLTTLDVSNSTALTKLSCSSNQLTTLDVSKNTALEKLDCYNNQLTSLVLNNNDALYSLDCTNNQLSTKALNALFESLNSVSDEKALYMIGNPGADDCDRSIAEKKAWRVEVYMDDEYDMGSDEYDEG